MMLWDKVAATLLILMVLAFIGGILDGLRKLVPHIVVGICVIMAGMVLYRVWFSAF